MRSFRSLVGDRRRGRAPSVRQVTRIPANSSGDADPVRVLMVGPGLDSIPPVGWGAVEVVVAEQARALSERNYDVTILNSSHWIDWIRARPWSVDIVMVHYEAWLPRSFRIRALFGVPVLACGHYGYLEWPEKWNESYPPWFDLLMLADARIALNSGIRRLFLSRGSDPVSIEVVPNGSDAQPLHSPTASKDVLILGKVEARKRQYEVFGALKSDSFTLTCAGPIEDSRVLSDLAIDSTLEATFVGPWSREEVLERLGDYSVLLLPSFGEADPLVLYEAQLAGLCVVVTAEAQGAQDPSLPWVLVLEDRSETCLRATVAEAIAINKSMRDEIREYSEGHYRWSERVEPLDVAIRRLLDGS